MNKQFEAITMRRKCRANDVCIDVNGSIADWPPWAAKAVVAVASQWSNDGFSRHFRMTSRVVAERIGEDAGGHDVVRVLPAITNGPVSRTAGAVWQAALEAVLLAQNA